MAHTSVHCLQIDACDEAYVAQSEVQHPLLEKVRQCSANPDQAASFFLRLFHPIPYNRVAAVNHTWTDSTISRMYGEMDFNCSTSTAGSRWFRVKQSCTRGLSAFLPCFGGESPTVEAETHLTGSRSHAHSETQDGDLLCSLSERMPSLLGWDEAFKSAVARTQAPESVQSKADSMQTAPSALQTCWNKVKKPFAGRSRRRRQQVNKGVTLPPAEAAPGAVEAVEAVKSAMAPAADKDQQVLIRAVTATAVPGIPPQLEVQDLQQQQQAISSCGQGLLSQMKGIVEMQDLQQQQQQEAVSSHGQGLLSQKKGIVKRDELLTDHEAVADMRQQGSSEEQLQQPAEGQSAESIR